MKIGELFVQLGVRVDKDTITAFNTAVMASIDTLTSLINLTNSAYSSFKNMAEAAMDMGTGLQNFAMQSDLSTIELQKWISAAKIANTALSAEDIQASILGLQKNLSQIKLGEGDVAPFQLLGIDVFGKNAFEVLQAVRQNIQDIDSATATNLLERMGLNPGMINVLRLSNAEFSKLTGNIIIDDDQQKVLSGLSSTLEQLKFVLTSITTQIMAKLAPVLDQKIKVFINFLLANKDNLINTSTKVLHIIIRIAEALGSIVGLIYKFFSTILSVKEGIIALGIAIAAAVGLALTFASPVILMATGITAAIAGILLLLEDIAVWSEGGDSLFGKVYDYISVLANKIYQVVGEILAKIWEIITALTDFLAPVIVEIGNLAVTISKPIIKLLVEIFKLVQNIVGFIVGNAIPGIISAIGQLLNALKPLFVLIRDIITFCIQGLTSIIGFLWVVLGEVSKLIGKGLEVSAIAGIDTPSNREQYLEEAARRRREEEERVKKAQEDRKQFLKTAKAFGLTESDLELPKVTDILGSSAGLPLNMRSMAPLDRMNNSNVVTNKTLNVSQAITVQGSENPKAVADNLNRKSIESALLAYNNGGF